MHYPICDVAHLLLLLQSVFLLDVRGTGQFANRNTLMDSLSYSFTPHSTHKGHFRAVLSSQSYLALDNNYPATEVNSDATRML